MSDATADDEVSGAASTQGGQTPAESLLEQREGSGSGSDYTEYAVAGIFGGATAFVLTTVFLSLLELTYITAADARIGFRGAAPHAVQAVGVLVGLVAGVELGKRRSNLYPLYLFSLAASLWLAFPVTGFLFDLFVPDDPNVSREVGVYSYILVELLVGVVLMKTWDELYTSRVSRMVSMLPAGDRVVGSRVSRRAAWVLVVGVGAIVVGFNVV